MNTPIIDALWEIKFKTTDVRELLWAYFDRWPPLNGENNLMYKKVCDLYWNIGQDIQKAYKDDLDG